MLCTLNISNFICQLYLSRVGGEKNNINLKEQESHLARASMGLSSPSLCLVPYYRVFRARVLTHVSFCFSHVVGWLVGWLKEYKLFSLESVQELISNWLMIWGIRQARIITVKNIMNTNDNWVTSGHNGHYTKWRYRPNPHS